MVINIVLKDITIVAYGKNTNNDVGFEELV
jgi:hypothetical protein